MSHQAFSHSWAQAWADELRISTAYRQAAAKWEGSLVLEARAGGNGAPQEQAIAVFVDLLHGECRAARCATADDLQQADFLISAEMSIWKKVLAGKVDPIFGLMSGKLKLARGSLARLTPYFTASKELVRAATRIETVFPGEAVYQAEAVFPEEVASPAADPLPADGPAPNDTAPPQTPASATSNSAPTAPDAAASETPACTEREYRTTSPRGLDHSLPVMGLWRKGKKLGVWDPSAIDFSTDKRDWQGLSALEQEVILHLTSLFQAGEESVTLDLLPLVQVIAEEGRLEEEMYLTSFLFEEAKHVEVFRRFLDEVAEDRSDLSRFHGPGYRRIFYDQLPTAMARLRTDPSPIVQAEASVTYNMIVEGVLAETGYHAYGTILERNQLMPGMQQTVGYLKSDESRHLAYGVFLLSRLVAEHGEPVWRVIENRMDELLPAAIALINEIFERYETMPFGLDLEMFTDFAMSQFQRRIKRIEKARHQSLDELRRLPVSEIESAASDAEA